MAMSSHCSGNSDVHLHNAITNLLQSMYTGKLLSLFNRNNICNNRLELLQGLIRLLITGKYRRSNRMLLDYNKRVNNVKTLSLYNCSGPWLLSPKLRPLYMN